MRKSGSSFRHGSVLVPKECLYQKEATRMESLKSIPLLGAKTALTSSGRQTTPSRVSQYRAENGNLRKNGCTFFTMVPCLHERNAYMKRKLEVWRVLKCIPLVGAKMALTSAGRQTIPSHVSQRRVENGNLRKSGVRGVSDSPEGMTPQLLAPKDQLTPPWRK